MFLAAWPCLGVGVKVEWRGWEWESKAIERRKQWGERHEEKVC